jgi:hypothetical protein
MPTIYKLSPEEVRSELDKGKSQRQIVIEQYDAMLEGFAPHDWGEVKLDSDEKRATVRNRLKSAAQRRGLAIRFKRGQGDSMRFEVLPAGTVVDDDENDDEELEAPKAATKASRAAAKNSDQEPAEPTTRRRGRPRARVS